MKNLYKLEVEYCASLSTKVEKVQSQNIGELCHRQLGHLHHGAFKTMQQNSTGLPKGMLEKVNTCKGCTLGKFTKASFHDRDSREKVILEQVHLDMCGPFSIAFTTKHKYYVIFVDDFSRKFWIFFMHKKNQTFTKFCEFKALVKKESSKKVLIVLDPPTFMGSP